MCVYDQVLNLPNGFNLSKDDLLESDNGMAPPNPTQRLNEIEPRIKRIEEALRIAPQKPRSPFSQIRSHVWHWIVAHKSWVIPITAILVSIGGWFGSGLFKYWLDHKDDPFNRAVDERIDGALKAPSGVLAKLSDIEKKVDKTNTTLETLQPFIHDVISHQFENVSKLSPQTLGERLPSVGDLLAAARNQDVKIDPRTTENLKRKLFHVPNDAPSYWSVAAELISYHSELKYGSSISVTTFPPCEGTVGEGDLIPPESLFALDKNGKRIPESEAHPTRVGAQNCFVNLDGRNIAHWDCTHCAIMYSDGPRSIIDARLKDCIFIVGHPIRSIPKPLGQRLDMALLESDWKNVAFGSS